MGRIAQTSLERRSTAYKRARARFHRFRYQADFYQKVGLALGFAAITGLAAQIQIILPFTPIPITFTTFAVLLTGIALGARWGGISQTLYVGFGVAGLPWFAGTRGGIEVILGATGGYIIGFIMAAMVVGYYTETFSNELQIYHLGAILLGANFIVIYGVGLPWFFGWLTVIQGTPPSVMDLFAMGFFPFILGDIFKLVLVLPIANAIMPVDAS